MTIHISDEAIDLAHQSYKVAMARLGELRAARRQGQHVPETTIWLYAQLAQEAAATLAAAWTNEAERLLNMAIDELEE